MAVRSFVALGDVDLRDIKEIQTSDIKDKSEGRAFRATVQIAQIRLRIGMTTQALAFPIAFAPSANANALEVPYAELRKDPYDVLRFGLFRQRVLRIVSNNPDASNSMQFLIAPRLDERWARYGGDSHGSETASMVTVDGAAALAMASKIVEAVAQAGSIEASVSRMTGAAAAVATQYTPLLTAAESLLTKIQQATDRFTSELDRATELSRDAILAAAVAADTGASDDA